MPTPTPRLVPVTTATLPSSFPMPPPTVSPHRSTVDQPGSTAGQETASSQSKT